MGYVIFFNLKNIYIYMNNHKTIARFDVDSIIAAGAAYLGISQAN